MFVDYAKIIILVKAQDSDVNGPDEIKLSDDVACMEEDLAQGEILSAEGSEIDPGAIRESIRAALAEAKE